MTYEVQQTRWDRLIRRVSGSIGPGSRVSETLSELFPVIDIERIPGELLLLGGTRLGMVHFPVNPGVGVFGGAQLGNPENSGAIITITRVILSANSIAEFLWNTTTIDYEMAIPAASRLRDTREIFPRQPVGVFRSDSALGVPVDSQGSARIAGNTEFTLEDPNGVVILAPGRNFTVGVRDANVRFLPNFFWRERAAEQSELQF